MTLSFKIQQQFRDTDGARIPNAFGIQMVDRVRFSNGVPFWNGRKLRFFRKLPPKFFISLDRFTK